MYGVQVTLHIEYAGKNIQITKKHKRRYASCFNEL